MDKFQVAIPVSIFRDGGTFVAYSPALDISTCAGSLSEVKERFKELVNIFFEELYRKGTTDEVLESLGWKKENHIWSPPEEIEHSTETFTVPLVA